ncbi:MAG: DNA-formamidopyrimidine glycosylase, partial [Nitrospinae bacterium RIFCSPLOWO2_12_FULL_47_7]
MPELPEVETLRQALLPLIRNKVFLEISLFRKNLRFPIPERKLRQELLNVSLENITRRGKYLLLEVPTGAMLWHLGMSGRVTQRPSAEPMEKHTHAVFRFKPDIYLHFIDPRRFGCILWVKRDSKHPLLKHLGLEPLEAETTAEALHKIARNRKVPVKSFVMDSRRIVGVGNIYACESLFGAGIHPNRPAGKLSLGDWARLLATLRKTLGKSIASGGTTLRDFYNSDGTAGYFSLSLSVYGREQDPC